MSGRDDLVALRPVARAAFDAAAARLATLDREASALSAEADRLRRATGLIALEGEANRHAALTAARFENWRHARLREIESQRATLEVDRCAARAEAARAFGRLQILRELSAKPPGARYRR